MIDRRTILGRFFIATLIPAVPLLGVAAPRAITFEPMQSLKTWVDGEGDVVACRVIATDGVRRRGCGMYVSPEMFAADPAGIEADLQYLLAVQWDKRDTN
jgi:hypothetical protein